MEVIRMSKEQEYRDFALTTLELAKKHPAGTDKGRLLVLAEAWIDLAERVAQKAKIRFRRASGETDKIEPANLDN
jgi:hypothetical protein